MFARLRARLKNGLLVTQATRLCRPATRRTGRERPFEPMGAAFRNVARNSSGRRVADRGGRVARATHFQNRLSGAECFHQVTDLRVDVGHRGDRVGDLRAQKFPAPLPEPMGGGF